MTTERVTVSLPEDVRRTSFRARLVDAWLAEHQAEHGVFDEDELLALAMEVGVPYLAARAQ